MSIQERDLNPDDPNSYYTWEINEEGILVIYSECCGDRFSREEMKVLYAALQEVLGSNHE